jgi:hypothetical protein
VCGVRVCYGGGGAGVRLTGVLPGGDFIFQNIRRFSFIHKDFFSRDDTVAFNFFLKKRKKCIGDW